MSFPQALQKPFYQGDKVHSAPGTFYYLLLQMLAGCIDIGLASVLETCNAGFTEWVTRCRKHQMHLITHCQQYYISIPFLLAYDQLRTGPAILRSIHTSIEISKAFFRVILFFNFYGHNYFCKVI